jgi:ribosome biogenesis GTPase / thiamine phosphate phosphatase
MRGKIIKLISNDYTVLYEGNFYVCKSRGKFRNMNITPLVGDEVIFDLDNRYIMEILPRKNSLVRPPVSNIDQAVVVMSLKEPDFSSNLLDKLLVVIESSNIKPIICFTKLDLVKVDEFQEIFDYYRSIGYEVYFNNQLELLKPIFKNKTTVFAGQSGAGKSSLLNLLDINLNIKTDTISKALGRGKHTTRHVELIHVLDGLIADTPGFSAIDLTVLTKEQIRDSFVEFSSYKDDCEYSDCMHENEIKCMIKQKVKENVILKSRHDNYLKFISK